MEWIEVSVTTTPDAGEAVSHILIEAGAEGVVEAGPAVRVAYFPSGDDVEARLARIQSDVAALASFGLDPGPASVERRVVAEESWADAWKQYFRPLPIGERLVVRPTWCEYTPASSELVIDLDPGMAFGTGTHPTTRLCTAALERTVRAGMRVIDIGTGSGILSIAALLLGAGTAIACDTDPLAVGVAQENAALNGVGDRIEVVQGSWDRLIESGVKGEIVVANIIASVIEELIPQADALLVAGGRLIVSGIVAFRKPGVVSTLARHGWTLVNAEEDDQWVLLEAVKTP